MSYKNGDVDTRKYLPQFSVNEWISFRERLLKLIKDGCISKRDEMILTELIVNMRSTAELAYLAETDKNFNWLISNQNRPISTRRIQQILTDYFPEFHIQATHKQNKKNTKIRTEQTEMRKIIITPDSVCAKCGSKVNLELHHMLPVVLGGDNDDRNLIILCQDCHQQTTNYFRTKLKQIKKGEIKLPE